MRNFLFFCLGIALFWSCNEATTTTTTTETTVESSMSEDTTPEKVLRHVVLFKFKEGTTDEDISAVENAFKALPAKIPQIRDFEWGTNNSPEGLEKGFTHCFFLTFHSEEDRDIYLPHPDHKAFGDIVGPRIDDVLVVDYWTE